MTTSAVQSPWGQIVNDLTTASYSTFDYQPTFQLPTEKNIVFSSGDSEMLKISPKGFWVRGVDLKYPEYQDKSNADEFVIGDLRNTLIVSKVMFAPEQSTLDKNGFIIIK
jgi:hypothetical protein